MEPIVFGARLLDFFEHDFLNVKDFVNALCAYSATCRAARPVAIHTAQEADFKLRSTGTGGLLAALHDYEVDSADAGTYPFASASDDADPGLICSGEEL